MWKWKRREHRIDYRSVNRDWNQLFVFDNWKTEKTDSIIRENSKHAQRNSLKELCRDNDENIDGKLREKEVIKQIARENEYEGKKKRRKIEEL